MASLLAVINKVSNETEKKHHSHLGLFFYIYVANNFLLCCVLITFFFSCYPKPIKLLFRVVLIIYKNSTIKMGKTKSTAKMQMQFPRKTIKQKQKQKSYEKFLSQQIKSSSSVVVGS